ncbi:MAG TPA: folylpolyglutamate synthase/dihydrofolate synthase family protein [Anaerolineae bacterium]|nr:folylpolyglutamate synthase/dihydrofolate synthase family protein [Anaerolineae bacterium]
MENDYRAALDYLYSLTNYEVKLATQYAGQLFDLSRMSRLLDAMEHPERRFHSVHVAGTNGKGSTAAMIASVLQHAGQRTGLFSSPHLHTFRERIQVDGQPITEREFVAHLRKLRPLFDTLDGLTTFEATQAIAFDYFIAQGADWAVVETGLGGRLDTTNLIRPEVAVITPVSYDHMLVLGDTLTAIAEEKAGIIKPRTPVVSAPQPEEALNVISHVAEHLQAPLAVVGREWGYHLERADWDGQHFTAYGPGVTLSGLFIPLLGEHQLVNATAALATLQVLRQGPLPGGAAGGALPIREEAIREGLRSVRWPARLEILSREPLLVVDGAHNGESMQRLVEALTAYFPRRRRVALFAALADKDVPRMFQALLPNVDTVIFSRTAHPRAADPAALARQAGPAAVSAIVEPDFDHALDVALGLAGRDGVVVATGSLSTAAAGREAWARRMQLEPLPSDPI